MEIERSQRTTFKIMLPPNENRRPGYHLNIITYGLPGELTPAEAQAMQAALDNLEVYK